MKRAHFDVEEDGFYGAYWARKGTVNACTPKYPQDCSIHGL